jgi:hypothetical protein
VLVPQPKERPRLLIRKAYDVPAYFQDKGLRLLILIAFFLAL